MALGLSVHPVQGIFTENKEKLIKDALTVLLTRCPDARTSTSPGEEGGSSREVMLQRQESRFQAIRRLVASKAGFEAFTQLPG